MIQSVHFKKFKSLKDLEIPFGKLNILAGLNSTGKSSVIQGLLLIRSVTEHIIKTNITANSLKQFPLNGEYLLSLGSAFDAISKETGKDFIIEIKEDEVLTNRFYTDESISDQVFNMNVDFSDSIRGSNLAQSKFYYLNAERLGPRIRHRINEKGGSLHCGFQGEFTVEVLEKTKAENAKDYNIDDRKFLNGEKLEGFGSILNYANQWMEYITPGSNIGNTNIIGKIRSATIDLNGFTPPNVGFGISYILPIIVTGLLAEKGSIMIVENPEAHLHPKGQSNIGFFLGQMASAGVQVIIETHSEHVINGIRRAVLSLEGIEPKDVNISFFSGIGSNKEAVVKQINLRETGDMTSFPRDFFDQVNQDMASLFRLKES